MSMSNFYKQAVCLGDMHQEAGYCEMSVENYDRLYDRCKKKKSKTCNAMVTEQVDFGPDIGFIPFATKRRVYLDKELWSNHPSLSINCIKDDVNEHNGDWKEQYILLYRGLYSCSKCFGRFDGWTDDVLTEGELVCKDCLYEFLIKNWKQNMEETKKETAVKIISNRFLEIKYNPEYKYCRDRLENLYNSEYDENYVEGGRIYKGNK